MNQINGRQLIFSWASVAALIAMVATGFVAACNETPVQFQSSTGAVQKKIPTSAAKQTKMDILWVVDNSGSMCQEQKVLRDNFDQFIDVIKNTTLDFHIGITTTHAPASDVKAVLETVAEEAKLQSQPQPVPGTDPSCLFDFDNEGKPIAQSYGPLRDALNGALECLADPNMKAQFQWSDAQIECANDRPTIDCADQLNVPDRNNDGTVDRYDLFPQPGEYKQFPKYLKASDYRKQDGTIDADQLKKDFGCMSLVGTQGDGYERGLQAAVKAVSPEWTGGIEGEDGADASKPNHGFIRKDAGFTLVFVTDENDCSAPDGAIPANNDCTADACDFYNSSAIPAGESPLYKVEDLAKSFRDNLEKTKGRQVSDGELLVASIHGNWSRFSEPLPSNEQCRDLGLSGREAKVISCETALGKARSGDRYERFIRQFANYYPNQVSKDDPLNFALQEVGWMCIGNFAPALTAIAEFLVGLDPACVLEDVYPCESDNECPSQLYSGQSGTCTTHPVDGKGKFCDSGIILQLVLTDPSAAQFADITQNPYCLPESIGQLKTDTPSCIVNPSQYTWGKCAGANGLTFNWNEPTTTVGQKLTGYELQLVYNAAISSEAN